MQDINISRRDMLKTAAAGVAGIALASAGLAAMPNRAFADVAANDLVPGTYKVSANLYVKYEDHGIDRVAADAYMTDDTNPLTGGDYPTHPAVENATMVVDANKNVTITIPVVNPAFMLKKIGSAEGAIATITATTTGMLLQKRATEVQVTLTSSPYRDVYKFTDCEEYAAHPAAFGTHTWPIYLSIDYASMVAA